MSAPLSPAKAALLADTSRWSILRAIRSGDLLATRDNRNAWRIRPEDLDAWLASRHTSAHPVRAHQPHTIPAHPGDSETAELRDALAESRAEVAGLRAEVTGLRDRLADTAADRDAWRRQAERGFWAWVRGLTGR
jgi:hypothetical protein